MVQTLRKRADVEIFFPTNLYALMCDMWFNKNVINANNPRETSLQILRKTSLH